MLSHHLDFGTLKNSVRSFFSLSASRHFFHFTITFNTVICSFKHQSPDILEGHFEDHAESHRHGYDPRVLLEVQHVGEEAEFVRGSGDAHVVEEYRELGQVDGVGYFGPKRPSWMREEFPYESWKN